MGLFWGAAKMSREAQFWKWFEKNQQALLNFEIDQERIFDDLSKHLQKVDRDLCFEFGPAGRTREFVISAGGIKRAFPAVVALANEAPPLARWKITAFRPRRQTLNTIEFRDVRVDPLDVSFSLLDNGTMAGVYLFIPGFQESNLDFGQAGYLMLDEALGEYDVETRVGLIKMFAPGTPSVGERYPIAELPVQFDQVTARLEGRTGMVS